ncbi:PAS domain S-box protein [Gillisia sp. M10.2A]|uniref:histidine kinase n=1 Tax=Gillisia lutea TaxID=2909668 RepID=A0ABS9ELD8_9FLAO|nr:PAS domain S-box protein [Gillisia lutea]MCF4102689.1 PAS domain S-box protein [Gillisia lutea]
MHTRLSALEILVIEDHLGDYVLIEDYLSEEHLGIMLSRASTFGEAKIKLSSPTCFDAVLLDLSLPDVDDSEILVKQIVALTKNVPVIVLTGYANKQFGVKTLALGISDYLLKDELDAAKLSKSIFYSIERKKIQYQLSESEKIYKSLFDSSPMPMWVLDKHSLEFIKVNDAAIELYGYSREEFLKMTVRDLWIEEVKLKIETIWSNNIDDLFELEAIHKTKNGSIIHVQIKSNPIEFNGKEARVTLVTNVTAQLEAERTLKLREQRFKALVQDGSELVMILDFDGALKYVSPASNTILGIPSEEFLKHNFFYSIHQDDIKDVQEHIFKLHDNKRIQIPTYRVKTANNRWRWIETIVTNLNDDPAVNGIVANSRDITEFVNQEKKLIESLQRYDIVAKATSDTITDYDVEQNIMNYNEGIETMFGYNRDTVERSREWFQSRIHPEDKERVLAKVAEVYKNGHPTIQIEYRFCCSNGTYKYVLDRSYLVSDTSGKPLRMIGSMQDMTNIHNYIETIENHNARLKEIAWTQSHVVRAPLARIMGIIDLLQNHDNVEDSSQMLEHIITSAQELDIIIRKISNKTELVKQNSLNA